MGRIEEILEEMLAELESQRLEVTLAPAPSPAYEGHMIRVCNDKNTDWYRRLCGTFPSGRVRRNTHFDTKIKRRFVVRVLERMASGEKPNSYIADYIWDLAKRREEKEPF